MVAEEYGILPQSESRGGEKLNICKLFVICALRTVGKRSDQGLQYHDDPAPPGGGPGLPPNQIRHHVGLTLV